MPESRDLHALRVTIVGNGRLGNALARALRVAGVPVDGPLSRGDRIVLGTASAGTRAVLLCVPDREIANAARLVPAGPLVAHCSASAPLDLLAPHARFSMHPLMTFVRPHAPAADAPGGGSPFVGAACVVDGSSDRALAAARTLSGALGMVPVAMAAGHRALYHAAASMASNYLVTLEAAAERLARESGIDRAALTPLVRAAVENWSVLGFEGAITGPIARGDLATVAAQRAAVAATAPDLLALWDTLADATRARVAAGTAHATAATPSGLQVVRSVAALRAAVAAARAEGHRIGFVPTMGAFHDGHLELMGRARAECGLVVVSLFVNPSQFNDPRDLEAYPRDEARDARLAAGAGAHVLFAPPVAEVYPAGAATTVEVTGVTEPLEGAARGTAHFRGVATVVAKLFNMVRPDVAYFGQKDAQQALVVRRLAADLDFPLRIEVCPTVREPDGLAMSSRNVRLSPAARAQAPVLWRCLSEITRRVAAGERTASELLAHGHAILTAGGIMTADVEYLAIVDAETLAPQHAVTSGRATLVAIAARVGGVRLIDNAIIPA